MSIQKEELPLSLALAHWWLVPTMLGLGMVVFFLYHYIGKKRLEARVHRWNHSPTERLLRALDASINQQDSR